MTTPWSLTLASPLYTFGRVGALYDMYSLQTDKVELEKSFNKDRALQVVIDAYVNALSKEKSKQVAKKSFESAQKTHEFTTLEWKGGAIKKVDYMKSEARLEQSHAGFISADVDADVSVTRLKIALGLPEDI